MLASSYLHNVISPIGQRHSRPSSYFAYAEVQPIFNEVKGTILAPSYYASVSFVAERSERKAKFIWAFPSVST